MNITQQDFEEAMFLLYEKKVRQLTEKNFKKSYLKYKELRGDGWHLDHKVSIKEAYYADLPPEMTAHEANLEMVPKQYNLQKGSRSSITISELINEIVEMEDQY